MELTGLTRLSEFAWRIEAKGRLRVSAVIYGSEQLLGETDEEGYEQAVNVATLPGIVKAWYALPDAHRGYGFPVGGVATFDADESGVVICVKGPQIKPLALQSKIGFQTAG